jgi:dihydrofolate synthase / folylpolyglutamate synthase
LDYAATLHYLFERLPMYQRVGAQAYKKDLTNTLRLCAALGNPQEAFPSIHIAGTNGKGSVSSMTASTLMEAGYHVGLYTSPHLRSFTERIRVAGKEIPEQAVVAFVRQYRDLIEEVEPSFFEATVAMAFWWFRECEVEAAVIEVGMGGRLDSTNVIQPVAGAITNISMDHAQHLGDTRALIAAEKAGIFKAGRIFAIGESDAETEPVYARIAAEKGAQLVYARDMYQVERLRGDWKGQDFKVRFRGKSFFEDLHCDLPGLYQAENVATALTLFDLLKIQGYRILPEHISEGLANVKRNAGLMGRMTQLGEEPLVLTDVGHNEAGIAYVLKQLATVRYRHLHFVIGMVNDKEIGKILRMLPSDATYYFVKPDVPRGLDAALLAEQAHAAGLKGEVYASVGDGLAAAKAAAMPDDVIFAGGSTFVVAEVI